MGRLLRAVQARGTKTSWDFVLLTPDDMDRIKAFLIQATRQRTDFQETIKQLTKITQSWDNLLGIEN